MHVQTARPTHALPTIIGITILGVALVLALWPGEPEARPVAKQQLSKVRVAPVTRLAAQRSLRLPAVTRAAQRVTLAFTVPSRLVTRAVAVADQVAAGTVLASLDDRELQHAVSAARATLAELEVRLAQARRDQERVEQLAAARAATGEELEKVSALAAALAAARDAARAQHEDARRLLAEAVLIAPFAGTVTAVLAEPGEWLAPGQPVIELSGDGAVELEVEVSEPVVAGLTIGDPVTAELPLAGYRQVIGRIAAVSRAAGGPGRLFPVVVELAANQSLVAGMTAELLLQVQTAQELAVPLAAVLNPGATRPTLFRVREGRAEQLHVHLGRLHDDLVVVRAELAAGELVVVSGHTVLTDGEPVEVR